MAGRSLIPSQLSFAVSYTAPLLKKASEKDKPSLTETLAELRAARALNQSDSERNSEALKVYVGTYGARTVSC